MEYDLNGLDEHTFEQLSRALALHVLGPGVGTFVERVDGGREAVFHGMFAAPPPGTEGLWGGYGVLVSAYRKPTTTTVGAAWLRAQVRAQLDRLIHQGNKRATGYRVPDYMIFATNIAVDNQVMGELHDLIAGYSAQGILLKGWRIWDSNAINRYLDSFPNIRRSFAHLVAPADILESILSLAPRRFGRPVITDPAGALAALNAGTLEALVEAKESWWLDAKSGPYRLNDSASAGELVKDVVAFANGRGGLLLVGFSTRVRGGLEVIDKVRPVPQAMVDVGQHRKLLRQQVRPLIRDLDFMWVDAGNDKGVLAIHVPGQAETDKPFIVPGLAGKGFNPAVGVPIRDGDTTHWLPRSELQRLLTFGWNASGRKGQAPGPYMPNRGDN
jgi:hypothetical protein